MPESSKVDAPAGREMDMGLALYAPLARDFTERTVFTTLACQVACAAYDSGDAAKFIDALAAAAKDIAPLVPRMREERGDA